MTKRFYDKPYGTFSSWTDIHTVSFDFSETNGTMRSQSDMLPTFMKTAKNREGIVKLLTRMQTK